MFNYLVILVTAVGMDEKDTFDVPLSRWTEILEDSLFYAFSSDFKYQLKKVGDYAHVQFKSKEPINYWRDRFSWTYGEGAADGWMEGDITINDEYEELYIWLKTITILN